MMLRITTFTLLFCATLGLKAVTGNVHTKNLRREPQSPSAKDLPEIVADEPKAETPTVKDLPKVEAKALPKIDVEAPALFLVPTTSRCIVIMVCQYMIVYLALTVCRSYHEFSGSKAGSVEAGLKAAAQTLTYGPMLCVLFIACRMRVEFLSNGTDQPQMWVQKCMYALTFAVLGSTVLVLITPVLTSKPHAARNVNPNLPVDLEKPQHTEGQSIYVFYTLTTMRYLILLGLYGGLAGVIVGINVYLPPGHDDFTTLPPPAPAVACTMMLAKFFFAIQLVIAGCRSYTEFTGVEFRQTIDVMHAGANTVEFAPMLAIVFLAARMRALQHDSQPQRWAQDCMFASTYAMCATTLLAIAVPVVLAGKVATNPETKETTFEVPNTNVGYALVALRFLCMFGFYGGVMGVIYSIIVFQAPGGAEATLPVSPTVQCVINLASQFFFVYAVLIVCVTVNEVSGGKVPLSSYKFYAAVQSAKATLAFAPMLAILFVTTRMYALLITDNKGAPQAWVQDGMYMATWSLLISFLSYLITGFVMEVDLDEDGNVINTFTNKYVAIAMTILRYFTMFLLYVGIATVIAGLFVMTPETANGSGSIPLMSDAVNSTPIGNAPPGPSSVGNL